MKHCLFAIHTFPKYVFHLATIFQTRCSFFKIYSQHSYTWHSNLAQRITLAPPGVFWWTTYFQKIWNLIFAAIMLLLLLNAIWQWIKKNLTHFQDNKTSEHTYQMSQNNIAWNKTGNVFFFLPQDCAALHTLEAIPVVNLTVNGQLLKRINSCSASLTHLRIIRYFLKSFSLFSNIFKGAQRAFFASPLKKKKNYRMTCI